MRLKGNRAPPPSPKTRRPTTQWGGGGKPGFFSLPYAIVWVGGDPESYAKSSLGGVCVSSSSGRAACAPKLSESRDCTFFIGAGACCRNSFFLLSSSLHSCSCTSCSLRLFYNNSPLYRRASTALCCLFSAVVAFLLLCRSPPSFSLLRTKKSPFPPPEPASFSCRIQKRVRILLPTTSLRQ